MPRAGKAQARRKASSAAGFHVSIPGWRMRRLIASRSQAMVASTSFAVSASRSVTNWTAMPAWRRAATMGSATKAARTSTAHSRQGNAGW